MIIFHSTATTDICRVECLGMLSLHVPLVSVYAKDVLGLRPQRLDRLSWFHGCVCVPLEDADICKNEQRKAFEAAGTSTFCRCDIIAI